MTLYVLLGLLLAVAVLILLAIARANQLLLAVSSQQRQLNERLGGLREDVQAAVAEISGFEPLAGEGVERLKNIHIAIGELQSCSPES